jgi:hypothetical protein
MISKRVKKRAKNLRNKRKLKMTIISFVVDYNLAHGKISIHDMLMHGHRGFMHMSEEELIRNFDICYGELNKLKKDMDDLDEAKRYVHPRIRGIQELLTRGDSICDILFEEIVL